MKKLKVTLTDLLFFIYFEGILALAFFTSKWETKEWFFASTLFVMLLVLGGCRINKLKEVKIDKIQNNN